MRRAAIVISLVLGGLAAGYGALVLLDLLARHEVRTSQRLVLPARGGLRLDSGSGDVTVQAGSGPPRLEAVARRGLFGGGDVRIVRGAGGRVSVQADCPGVLPSCETSLRAIVPAGIEVTVAADAGDVALRGLRDGVVARTGSGNVELDGVAGPTVSADTGSGDVEGSGLAPGRLVARTGSGDVQLDAATAPARTLVDTGSGDIELTLPDETYAVRADTGSGDSQVGVRFDDASPRSLRVKTGSGDITVRPAR